MTALAPSRYDYARRSNVWVPPRPALGIVHGSPKRSSVPRHAREWRPNLGQTSTQLAQTGISLATTGTVAGSAIAGASAIGAIAGPIGAIAGTLIGLLTQIFSGCGQSCTLTSDAANQIEQVLQQNLAAYFGSSRTQSEQAAALANFDNTWAKLQQYCGQPSFGSAGQNCITDRESGSCAYKTSPGSFDGCTWNGAGANNSGSTCWNWFVGYRDPIANDPCVVPDAAVQTAAGSSSSPAGVASSVSSAWSSLIADPLPLFLIGGILLLAVIL
jgi:hypothetical protein